MKTDFIPKLVATVASCCVLYGVVTMTSSLLSVKAVASVGYIESLVSVFSDSLVSVVRDSLASVMFNRPSAWSP